MSRPINSTNKIKLTQTSSILQVQNVQGGNLSVQAGGTKSLDLDVLNVKNIYLLDSLITKSAIDINSVDRLQFTKGSIFNKFSSSDPTKKAISFNNVYFQPDAADINTVTVFTSNILKLGNINSNLELNGSNVIINSTNSFVIPGNLSVGNLTITNSFNYLINSFTIGSGGSGNIDLTFNGSNDGIIRYDPTKDKFNILSNVYIKGNLELDTPLSLSNINIINASVSGLANVGSLIVNNGANFKENVGIDYNLFVLGNANVNGYVGINGILQVNSNIYSYNNLVANNIVIKDRLLKADAPNYDLTYNSNVILTINSANILNRSNIVIVDPTNTLDVMLDVQGNISCHSVYLTSNVKKKKNIRDITDDEINNLNKVKSYNFDLISNNVNNYGFLAHEVMDSYPMLSNGETVNYIGFIPLLLSKIKILEEEIISLKNKINNL